MRFTSPPLVLGASAFLLATLAVSFADAAIFSDRSLWETDLNDDGYAIDTEDFEDESTGVLSDGDMFMGTDWTINYDPPDADPNFFAPNIVSGNVLSAGVGPGGGAFDEPTDITFTFDGETVYGWGADFIEANTSGGLRIETSAGESVDLTGLLPMAGSDPTFVGFTTMTPFSSITIFPQEPSELEDFSLDGLAIGFDEDDDDNGPGPGSGVPEPATIVILVFGLAVAALRRRRRASSSL